MVILTDTDTRVRMNLGKDAGKEVYITRDIWKIDRRVKRLMERVKALHERRNELIAEYERLEKEGW